jgi:hypothetical protein
LKKIEPMKRKHEEMEESNDTYFGAMSDPCCISDPVFCVESGIVSNFDGFFWGEDWEVGFF